MSWLSPGKRKWLGGCAWVATITLAALLVRLPGDVAADYLERYFAGKQPGYRLAVDQVAVTPLLRLRAVGCAVSAVGGKEPLWQFAEVEVAPSLWRLLLGEKKIAFAGSAYGGTVAGEVLLAADAVLPAMLELRLRQVQLERYPGLQKLLGRQLEGELSGDVVYRGGAKGFADGEGQVEVSLRDGKVELLQPLLGFAFLDLGEVAVALEIKKRKATVKRFTLQGREVHGTITGSVNIQNRLLRSRLTLRGEMEPDQNAFLGTPEGEKALKVMEQFLRNGKIRIGISGTCERPKIRVL